MSQNTEIYPIGIDLGTTSLAMGTLKCDELKLLTNENCMYIFL